MPKHPAHRFFDAVETPVYAAGTLVAGAATTAFATATLALAVTGIGLPVAVPFGLGTLALAAATTYAGSKTVHKASHVMGGDGDCHSLSHAKEVLTLSFK